ncbi:MAG: GlsB/YeaQ/YmgE family stress response membrane protein [Chloroflexota bacterium]
MDFFDVVPLGVLAGWLASQIMDSGIYRRVGNVVFGILGAYVGIWLASQLLGVDVARLSFASGAVGLASALTMIVLFSMLGPGRQTLGQIVLGR